MEQLHLETKRSFMYKAYVGDGCKRGRGVQRKGRHLVEFLELGVCLSESLVTYICLLVIPLPEPEGP